MTEHEDLSDDEETEAEAEAYFDQLRAFAEQQGDEALLADAERRRQAWREGSESDDERRGRRLFVVGFREYERVQAFAAEQLGHCLIKGEDPDEAAISNLGARLFLEQVRLGLIGQAAGDTVRAAWPSTFRTWCEEYGPRLASQGVVRREADGGEALARQERAEVALLVEVERHAPNLIREIEEVGEAGRDEVLKAWFLSLREKGRELAAQVTPDVWDDPLRLYRGIALALWRDVVRPALQQADRGPGALYRCVEVGSDQWVKVQKIAAPASWAWGAPGEDGHAAVPDAVVKGGRTVLVPRGYRLSVDGQAKPHQAFLPYIINVKPEPLAVAIVGASGHDDGAVLSPLEGKLSLLILASDVACTGTLLETTIGELARILFPTSPRARGLRRDRERIADALRNMRGVSLLLPDGRDVQCFNADTVVGDPHPDLTVRLGVAPTLAAVLRELRHSRPPKGSPLRSYRGEFLLNLSGAMRLDARTPAALRLLVRESAEWNACHDPRAKGASQGRLDPSRIPWRTLEEIARRAHTTPGEDASANTRKMARTRTSEVLDMLEAEDLFRLEVKGKGRGRRWRILPPKSYSEAFAAWREGPQAGGRYRKE